MKDNESRAWFACIFARSARPPAGSGTQATAADLLLLARECSPRVELMREQAVIVDASGLTRLFGGPEAFGDHVRRAAAERGFEVAVGLAATRTAALLIASVLPGVTVVPPRCEASTLAPLPLQALGILAGEGTEQAGASRTSRGPARHYRIAPRPEPSWTFDPVQAPDRLAPSSVRRSTSAECRDLFETLERWGLRTLGDLAALPPADLFERLGSEGARWRRLACGEDERPLVRESEPERFEQTQELEWPIEGLEPLSFVLARLLDPMCAQLERRDRGAVSLHLWLKLVTRSVHHRWLQLPVPMRDPKVLRTLLLLHLESHPPDAGIDRVTVAAETAPGRVLQFSLLERPLPSPDQISTLMARLMALMGEGRCGAPSLVDSHRPGAFDVVPFLPGEKVAGYEALRPRTDLPPPRLLPIDDGQSRLERGGGAPDAALRRFRHPVPASVALDAGRPVRVTTRHAGLAGGGVAVAAGPWRTSGDWWSVSKPPPGAAGSGKGAERIDARGWDCDEWDVALGDRGLYRLRRDRATGGWFVDGIWD